MTEKPTVNHKCQCAACRASRALSTLRALPALTDSTTEALDTIDEALSALIDDGAAGWAAMGDVAYAVGLDWPTATRRDILDAIRAASRRLAELAAALAVARDTSESVFRWAKALSDGMSRGRARVAELEAQLAAQQWRPGNVEPPAHDWYWVYDFADDDVPTRRFYGPQGWGMLGDEDAPDWYMAIPPLPAETTP